MFVVLDDDTYIHDSKISEELSYKVLDLIDLVAEVLTIFAKLSLLNPIIPLY